MRALVKITTSVKTYLPGEELGKEFSDNDIARLKRLKAVEGSYSKNNLEDDLFNESYPPAFLSENELNKLSPKAKLVEYAESIGLDGLTDKSSKEELVNSILNYIEELEDGSEE